MTPNIANALIELSLACIAETPEGIAYHHEALNNIIQHQMSEEERLKMYVITEAMK